jgi:hypothetical protein
VKYVIPPSASEMYHLFIIRQDYGLEFGHLESAKSTVLLGYVLIYG